MLFKFRVLTDRGTEYGGKLDEHAYPLFLAVEHIDHRRTQWLKKYNQFRPHAVSCCYGKTPWQTFQDAKKITKAIHLEKLFETDENTSKLLQQNTSPIEAEKSLYLTDDSTVRLI